MIPEEKAAISPGFLRLFHLYNRSYLARRFHAVRLLGEARPPSLAPDQSAVIYLNHASWWDPLLCLFLSGKLFAGHHSYAPIEAESLRRYPFLRHLGLFPLRQGSLRGGRNFLAQADHLLSQPASLLWLTPQGRFADVRQRPLGFAAGIGHVARRFPGLAFIPLAVEYTFWEERLPEALVAFGAPVSWPTPPAPAAACEFLENRLAEVATKLAASAQARDAGAWIELRRTRAGVNFIYSTWQRLAARVRGDEFRAEHSRL